MKMIDVVVSYPSTHPLSSHVCHPHSPFPNAHSPPFIITRVSLPTYPLLITHIPITHYPPHPMLPTTTTGRRARSLEKQLQQESGLGDVFADYASWGLSLGALYAGNKLLADVCVCLCLFVCDCSRGISYWQMYVCGFVFFCFFCVYVCLGLATPHLHTPPPPPPHTTQACTAAGITFPAPLLGMFAIVGALLLLSKTSPSTADAVYDAFSPAVDWIARWLPLFYVPLLVTIPLSIQVGGERWVCRVCMCCG